MYEESYWVEGTRKGNALVGHELDLRELTGRKAKVNEEN